MFSKPIDGEEPYLANTLHYKCEKRKLDTKSRVENVQYVLT